MKILKYIVVMIALLLVCALGFYRFWFLRLPYRHIPHSENVLVSPANGTVVSITPWNSELLTVTKKKNGFIHLWTKDVDTAGNMISIQMTPMHVHYQRAPVSGRVLARKYVKGNFNNAINMSNEYGIRHENEHNELLLETTEGKRYKVVQIAGFVARRIEDYVKPEQKLEQGEVIGLIKLGSQVTVLLPHSMVVKVTKGQTVIDGETILAEVP